jgi:CHAD domain-containing protein
MTLVPPAPGSEKPRFPLKLAATSGLLPDDAMSEAGRKILFQQFELMLKHEPNVRKGKDIEAVHDMRVATRRMRSAIRLFEPYFKRGSVFTVFGRSLKGLAAALGEVRDLDVFRERIGKHVDTLPSEEQEAFMGFRKHFEDPHQRAQRQLLELLNSANFKDFTITFHLFLTTPGAGSISRVEGGRPHFVRHVLPRLVYEQYATIRAYEPILGTANLDELHQLRIEAKRFRYTFEFFSEVLTPDAKTVINATKNLQEHLGDLQDARVAGGILNAYVKKHGDRADLRPVLSYLTNRESEKQRLFNGTPEVWAAFTESKIRRAVALSVASL